MNEWIDQAESVRPNEHLKKELLIDYLKAYLPGINDQLEILQFGKGYSNLTYLIKTKEKEYVLRRPPFGANVKSGHDMEREFRILFALHPTYAKVPKPILFAKESNVMDCSFYVMERVHGVILRSSMPEKMQPDAGLMFKISKSLFASLVELHKFDFKKVGLENLGKPEAYTDRQIAGWKKRYLRAKTDDYPEVGLLASYLENNKPKSSKAALIHNDFKYDNLILDQNDWTKVLAILDWEMCTLGDPLMDLGTSLAYWINHDDPDWMKKLALSPTTLKGNPKREEVLKIYEEMSGEKIVEPVFYYAYGLFKIIGITQQIYYRYKHGFTKDKRFANLNYVVKNLAKVALRAIEKDRI